MTDTVTVSWIEETAASVHLARNAHEAQKNAEVLDDAAVALGRSVERLQGLAKSASVVRGLGWSGRSASPELMTELNQAVSTLGQRPLGRLPRLVDEFAADVGRSIEDCWSSHAEQQLGDVADLLRLADSLAGVEGISDLSHNLRTVLHELERDSRPTAQSVESLKRAKQLLSELEASLKPDEVRRFLSAVARGGASVESLTPEVKSWLGDYQSLKRFKVVAGAPLGDTDD